MGPSPGNECGWAPDGAGRGLPETYPPRPRVRAGSGEWKPAPPRPVTNTTYGARRSPLIYPASRIRSDRQPRPIPCYQMCSNDSTLWCWEATTQMTSDGGWFQRRGWRGVLSLFCEVRARQGRVTLAQKSLWGVPAAKRSTIQRALEKEGLLGARTPRKDLQGRVTLP